MNRNSVAAKTAGLPYVLIVQKGLEDREAMKTALIENYEVHVAADGFQVLSLVLERKPASEHHRGGEAELVRKPEADDAAACACDPGVSRQTGGARGG